MRIIQNIGDMREASRRVRQAGKRVGFVPTMGALHEGHLSLVRGAKAQSDVVAASIFVNPTQFGPNEDFSKYPRTFERDCELFTKEGVELLFAPTADDMYPAGAVTYVTVEGMSERLCGKSRPGHFRGVTTVVSKLFNIVEPNVAFFGQKDAAQVAIIRHMVRDLNIPVEIAVCPIVREADGLAMSSRNTYLDPQQRQNSLVLQRSLQEVKRGFEAGEKKAAKLIEQGREVFNHEPSVRLDYLEIVDPNNLEALDRIEKQALVAVAAYLGKTRLIDNLVLYA